MDSDGESIHSHAESEEDDVGCYFLQPSSNPYNISERIQQANDVLFTSMRSPNNEKTCKVKFKEELISFEPDITDEDVNSLESDNSEIISNNPSPLSYRTTLIDTDTDLNIFDTEEVDEAEEVIEEVNSEAENVENQTELKIFEDGLNKTETSTMNGNSSKGFVKKCGKQKQSCLNNHEVRCKDHCIDKLSFDLSMSISKLQIHEKVALPPLQLLQRKCCEKQTVHRNLPNYDGLRSEYGLTYRQLEKREKQKEILKLKEQHRKRLMEEYRNRKIQQNEEVFSRWLQEISRRRTEKQLAQKQKTKQCIIPVSINLPNKATVKVNERPRTANEFVPKTQIRKLRRPHTTSSCVFIEVPQGLLARGINIGDLIITNPKMYTKKLHILAVS